MESLEQAFKRLCSEEGRKYPFTFYFNRCRLKVTEDSTYESVGRDYYNNVDLSQFGGWK
jgi:hypothetical protein